ncbi:MAG: SDR family oxidoreductase [Oscillospiraceae bacterium]|nr:SDR family oxidoreductase [Oscillospiraceae bacterium]
MGLFTGKTMLLSGVVRSVLPDGRCGSIGYGIAVAYAKEGANLVITDMNAEKLNEARDELETMYGAKVLAMPVTLGPTYEAEQRIQQVVDETIKTFGRIDVLINCAQAAAAGVLLKDQTLEQFSLAINSGLYGTFLYMRACYPYLKETKGSVINFASGAGLFGNEGQASYAAAKEGIRGMSRVAATEWAEDGINVNVICPLAWTAALQTYKDDYPEGFEANVTPPPMGYFSDPEEDIGHICLQLGSPTFKYMSGETLALEGGLGQRP